MSNQPNNEEKKDDNKNKKDDEPEEEEYSCGLCCRGYANCIFCCCKGTYNCLAAIKNAIVACCAFFWYPIKERCVSCSDCCEKKWHPYTNPNYETITEL